MIRQYISESYQPDIQQCNMEARDKDKKKNKVQHVDRIGDSN